MNSIAIKGIICPILTPMYEDESINEQELRNQVNRLIDAGIHGLFAFGTNGESYALSTAEKERVLEIVVEETNHRVPVYAGSGCITTKETIALSKKAFEIGADALSIVTPFYAAASQEELRITWMLRLRWICPSSCTTFLPERATHWLPRRSAALRRAPPTLWVSRIPAGISTI